MKFSELAYIINENFDITLIDENGEYLDHYDGRDSISPEYGEYEVTEVSANHDIIIVEVREV